MSDPKRIAEMVRQTRQVAGYRPMPILFNEDDHFDFDKPANNFKPRSRNTPPGAISISACKAKALTTAIRACR